MAPLPPLDPPLLAKLFTAVMNRGYMPEGCGCRIIIPFLDNIGLNKYDFEIYRTEVLCFLKSFTFIYSK